MNFRVIRLHFSTTCEWEQAINGKISEKTQSQCHQFVMALDDNFFFRSRRSALRFPWAKDVLCSRCCRFLWAADFAVRRISCADVTCSLLQESVGGPLSVGHVAQSTCTILEYGSAQGYVGLTSASGADLRVARLQGFGCCWRRGFCEATQQRNLFSPWAPLEVPRRLTSE